MDREPEVGGSEQQSTLSFPTHLGGALHSVERLERSAWRESNELCKLLWVFGEF